jgi:hypothetical protein
MKNLYLSRDDNYIYRIELPSDADDRTELDAKQLVAQFHRTRMQAGDALGFLVKQLRALGGRIHIAHSLFYLDVPMEKIERIGKYELPA